MGQKQGNLQEPLQNQLMYFDWMIQVLQWLYNTVACLQFKSCNNKSSKLYVHQQTNANFKSCHCGKAHIQTTLFVMVNLHSNFKSWKYVEEILLSRMFQTAKYIWLGLSANCSNICTSWIDKFCLFHL